MRVDVHRGSTEDPGLPYGGQKAIESALAESSSENWREALDQVSAHSPIVALVNAAVSPPLPTSPGLIHLIAQIPRSAADFDDALAQWETIEKKPTLPPTSPAAKLSPRATPAPRARPWREVRAEVIHTLENCEFLIRVGVGLASLVLYDAASSYPLVPIDFDYDTDFGDWVQFREEAISSASDLVPDLRDFRGRLTDGPRLTRDEAEDLEDLLLWLSVHFAAFATELLGIGPRQLSAVVEWVRVVDWTMGPLQFDWHRHTAGAIELDLARWSLQERFH